jgi:hypothetical protein
LFRNYVVRLKRVSRGLRRLDHQLCQSVPDPLTSEAALHRLVAEATRHEDGVAAPQLLEALGEVTDEAAVHVVVTGGHGRVRREVHERRDRLALIGVVLVATVAGLVLR